MYSSVGLTLWLFITRIKASQVYYSTLSTLCGCRERHSNVKGQAMLKRNPTNRSAPFTDLVEKAQRIEEWQKPERDAEEMNKDETRLRMSLSREHRDWRQQSSPQDCQARMAGRGRDFILPIGCRIQNEVYTLKSSYNFHLRDSKHEVMSLPLTLPSTIGSSSGAYKCPIRDNWRAVPVAKPKHRSNM